MKLKISEKKRELFINVLTVLYREIGKAFGDRIGEYFFDPDDIPLKHLSQKQKEKIYKLREKATEQFTDLYDPLREIVDQLKDMSSGDSKFKIKDDMIISILDALKSLRKIYNEFHEYLISILDSSFEEEERARKRIQELQKEYNYITLAIENPYLVTNEDVPISVKENIDRFGHIIPDVEKVIKRLKKALEK